MATPTADELQDSVATNATKPQSVQTDAGTVTMQSTFNQLEVLKYLKEQEAAQSGGIGIKTRRIVNGNARGL